jgi:hypothetical protein
MKRSSSKKDYVVVRLNEYDNTWRDITKPATHLQAVRWVASHNYTRLIDSGLIRIVTLDEYVRLPISIQLGVQE